MPAMHPVDFLVVTILEDETTAVLDSLQSVQAMGASWLGKVPRAVGSAYEVAVIEVGEMGPVPAAERARSAIDEWQPRYGLLLVGISAGFPEAGVQLGDVLVPAWVMNYELGKQTETPKNGILARLLKRSQVSVTPRAVPTQVSMRLFQVAREIARHRLDVLPSDSLPQRPDGHEQSPVVHCDRNGLMGSGSRLVATAMSPDRKWLLKEYPPGSNPTAAIGLEMEGYGVHHASKMQDVPFLMVKGVQDPATVKKDAFGSKDAWRKYACAAAAQFAVTVMAAFEANPRSTLVDEHLTQCGRVAPRLLKLTPEPRFRYTVSLANSLLQIRRQYYERTQEPIEVLVPDEVCPVIVLHGGGGTGKSSIAARVFSLLLDDGCCPVLLDLSRYGDAADQQGANVDAIIERTAIPRRSSGELRELATVSNLAVIADGVNEVPEAEREALLDFLLKLDCRLLVMDRLGPKDSTLELRRHAIVDRLAVSEVRKQFDARFGEGAYEVLPPAAKRVLQRAFFLSLALRAPQGAPLRSCWSDYFEEFFRSHTSEGQAITEAELDALSEITVDAFASDGTFDSNSLRVRCEERLPGLYAKLVHAGVMRGDGNGYEHHLWRDYIVSRYLARRPESWVYSTFDGLTTFASSLECLTMAAQQMRDENRRDHFLRTVYDWNWAAATHCASQPSTEDDVEHWTPTQLALMALAADKRFDPIENTRQRAVQALAAGTDFPSIAVFREAESREELVRAVQGMTSNEAWFADWRSLFESSDGHEITPLELAHLESDDPVLGWTAANSIRRAVQGDEEESRIREIFARRSDNERIRWRCVAALGRFPLADNAELLASALVRDPSHWVKYGAARSIVEMGGLSDDDGMQRHIAMLLHDFVHSFEPVEQPIRNQVLKEIVEAALSENASDEWLKTLTPVLRDIVHKLPEPYSGDLSTRLQARIG